MNFSWIFNLRNRNVHISLLQNDYNNSNNYIECRIRSTWWKTHTESYAGQMTFAHPIFSAVRVQLLIEYDVFRLNMGYFGLNFLFVFSFESSAVRVFVASSYVGGSMSPYNGADGWGSAGALAAFAGGYGNGGIWWGGSNGALASGNGGAPGWFVTTELYDGTPFPTGVCCGTVSIIGIEPIMTGILTVGSLWQHATDPYTYKSKGERNHWCHLINE